MKAIEYWNRVAQPLVTRFEKEPTSYDLAFASCVVVFHITDYLKLERNKPARYIRDELIRKNRHFATVFAVASAVKHVVADHKNHGILTGLKSAEADVGKGRLFRMELTGVMAHLGRIHQTSFECTRPTGTSLICTGSWTMWRRQLHLI